MTDTPAVARSSRAIGRSTPRPDGEAKVRGATRYAADRRAAGLAHARLVLSPYAHATIVSVDPGPALAVPGVLRVLLAEDLALVGTPGERPSVPLARGSTRFAGDAVALVVAATPEAAADGAELVDVRYVPLDPVATVARALASDAPVVRAAMAAGGADASAMQRHAGVGGTGEVDDGPTSEGPNVAGRHHYRSGDAAVALAGAAVAVSGTFGTSWVHQGYLEPQTCTAWREADGRIVVETATQSIAYTRGLVARLLGLPHADVRIVPMPLGGAFGGKWGLFEPLIAFAATVVGRAVRLELTRREEFLSANPFQGMAITLRIGADADGRLVGLEERIVTDSGAFDGDSAEEVAAAIAAGPYRWPTYDIEGVGVRTNRPGVGAYRAPGGPQTAFALETLLDELAAALGLDPLELRRRNAVVPGDTMVDGVGWGSVGVLEVLAALERLPAWRQRASLPAGEGVGVALGSWPGAAGAAAAICRATAAGTVEILTGVSDMSGTFGGFAAIAAEILGLDVQAVRVIGLDSEAAPASPGSGGSIITYSTGPAIQRAAEALREQILEAAATQLEIDPGDLELVDGSVRPVDAPRRAIPIAEIVRLHASVGGAPLEAQGTAAKAPLAPQVAGQLVHVRVDAETGEVQVLGLHAVQDVGRAINPALVEDQMHGAAAQGIGWALREGFVYDAAAGLLTGSLLDYALPRAPGVPEIGTTIVEVPAEHGPFGARGVGESGVVPGAAAIANAIAAAVGVRPRELPITAPRLWRLLRDG